MAKVKRRSAEQRDIILAKFLNLRDKGLSRGAAVKKCGVSDGAIRKWMKASGLKSSSTPAMEIHQGPVRKSYKRKTKHTASGQLKLFVGSAEELMKIAGEL